jgi:hypothetical protein
VSTDDATPVEAMTEPVVLGRVNVVEPATGAGVSVTDPEVIP